MSFLAVGGGIVGATVAGGTAAVTAATVAVTVAIAAVLEPATVKIVFSALLAGRRND